MAKQKPGRDSKLVKKSPTVVVPRFKLNEHVVTIRQTETQLKNFVPKGTRGQVIGASRDGAGLPTYKVRVGMGVRVFWASQDDLELYGG